MLGENVCLQYPFRITDGNRAEVRGARNDLQVDAAVPELGEHVKTVKHHLARKSEDLWDF
jgi:hypothetical protein